MANRIESAPPAVFVGAPSPEHPAMYRTRFAEQHAVLLAVGILLGVGFISVFWQISLVIAAAVGAATIAWWICRQCERTINSWYRRGES